MTKYANRGQCVCVGGGGELSVGRNEMSPNFFFTRKYLRDFEQLISSLWVSFP